LTAKHLNRYLHKKAPIICTTQNTHNPSNQTLYQAGKFFKIKFEFSAYRVFLIIRKISTSQSGKFPLPKALIVYNYVIISVSYIQGNLSKRSTETILMTFLYKLNNNKLRSENRYNNHNFLFLANQDPNLVVFPIILSISECKRALVYISQCQEVISKE